MTPKQSEALRAFCRLWKAEETEAVFTYQYMTQRGAIRWLSKILRVQRTALHFEDFDDTTCEKIKTVCREYIDKVLNGSIKCRKRSPANIRNHRDNW